MEYVVGFILAVIGSTLVFELYTWLPTFCVWCARKASSFMNDGEGDRYEEEWLAYIDAMPNSFAMLVAASGFWVAAIKLRSPMASANWIGRTVAVPLLRIQYKAVKSCMKFSIPVLQEMKSEFTNDDAAKDVIDAFDFAIGFYYDSLKSYARIIRNFEKGDFGGRDSRELASLCCKTAICSSKITSIRIASKYPQFFTPRFALWLATRLQRKRPPQ